jgi:uncharacterized protein
VPQLVSIKVKPEQILDDNLIAKQSLESLEIKEDSGHVVRIRKRSIDARKQQIYYVLQCEVFAPDEEIPSRVPEKEYPDVKDANAVHIIGMGPAGIFAALRLIELGLKPVILERGKDVKARRRDLAAINKEHIVDSDSNYCFGEGGAGTYSDGKLYTRSGKRGNIQDVLETFVSHGADDNILINAHPHIGTNKLPSIMEHMRETILDHGGEVHFETRVDDIIAEGGKVVALQTNKGTIKAENLIVATGHSARDVFEIFHSHGWQIEAKAFALGVRVEHPQSFVDKTQYHGQSQNEFLPPAAYNLVAKVDGKGVYSFCMCPGGIIAPCATSQNEVVTNGWSPSKRNNPFANSGVVVTVEPEWLEENGFSGPLGGVVFQQEVEAKCWEAAGKTQRIPGQRLTDFVAKRKSTSLPETSYIPGVVSVNLHEVLPKFIGDALAKAFLQFDQKMRGYLTDQAVVVAPESRTSSPVRVPRDPDTLEHPDVSGLFPCGEGAGFAGGIVSAAIDGQRVAASIAAKVLV